MNKELSPLEALKELKYQVAGLEAATHDVPPQRTTYLVRDMGLFEIIETALKELDFKRMVIVDFLTGNDEKKLKALEIIKEKKVNIRGLSRLTLEEYNENRRSHKEEQLTQEEFDLLKEVLL